MTYVTPISLEIIATINFFIKNNDHEAARQRYLHSHFRAKYFGKIDLSAIYTVFYEELNYSDLSIVILK